MKGTTNLIALLLATSLALGLSGCADNKSEPAPTTSAPAVVAPTTSAKPAPTTSVAPATPMPGLAHNANYTFKHDANIANATFVVNQSWATLTFGSQMWKTQQCGILQAEPPAGTGTGPQPAITFTSPSGKKVGPISLGTYSSCDVNTNNKVGSVPSPTTAAGEEGTWKIQFNGRGVGVQVQVRVDGS